MILLICFLLATPMHSFKEEGKSLGHTGKAQGHSQIEHFQSNELLSSNQRGELFDAEKARESVLKNQIPNSEHLDYLQSSKVQQNEISLADTEYFLERSESITQNAQIQNLEIEEPLDYRIETCRQSDAPYPIYVIRNLQVEVACKPGASKEVKVCAQHNLQKKFHRKKEAEECAKRLKQSFSKDPSIKRYEVSDPTHGGLLHRYIVDASWEHIEDAQTCNNYQTQQRTLSSTYEEIRDKWIYENASFESLARKPDCTFFKSECLDATHSKIINNKEVQRSCWKEKLTFICQLLNSHDCPPLKQRGCELLKKECLQEGPYGCSLWELTFKCYSKFVKRKLGDAEIYGVGEEEEAEYEPNDSFSEIAAKLAVFDSIKKDLEGSQAPDARTVQVFTGNRMQCSKSVADDLLYDCCFSYSGLAKEIGLKTCSADELALAEMRENGLCHYVGSYNGKFCDLWKSRDEHVFCCFGSKLARVLQENAREQLSISWDKPKYSDCRGLLLGEISQLDFSKMDFSELYADYEKKLPTNFKSKLESLENRIKEKVREHDV